MSEDYEKRRPVVDAWKAIAGILGSVLLTGLTSWFAYGQNTVRWPELKEYIISREENSAYARDKQIVMEGIATARITASGADMKTQKLQNDVIRMETKLDQVLQELTDLRKERKAKE